MSAPEYSASPHVYTCRWSSLKGLPSFVLPVRISIGKPRFIPGADEFPAIHELMPYGILGVDDQADFTKRFRHRLHRKTPQVIQERFDHLHARYDGRPLVLLCYEDLTKVDQWCHRTIFREWWRDKTGAIIHDLQHVDLLTGEIAVPTADLASTPDPTPEPPTQGGLF